MQQLLQIQHNCKKHNNYKKEVGYIFWLNFLEALPILDRIFHRFHEQTTIDINGEKKQTTKKKDTYTKHQNNCYNFFVQK